MQQATPLELVLKRDRAVVLGGILIISALTWAYLLNLSWGMQKMMGKEMMMAQMRPWGAADFTLTFIMWAVMMAAMMLPSAAPMILLFTGVHRRRKAEQRPYVPASLFLSGYLVVWFSFSAAASITQGGLHNAALLSPWMASSNPMLGGALLMAAGVFQWSPLKSVCLSHCRSPLGFLMTEWREGIKGTVILGLRHGVFCLGCCWVLMALLFVLGVMNLLWIAALAGFVLIEKLTPAGQWIGRFTGVLLFGWGAWMILASLG